MSYMCYSYPPPCAMTWCPILRTQHLLWVSKPGWFLRLRPMDSSDSPLVWHLPTGISGPNKKDNCSKNKQNRGQRNKIESNFSGHLDSKTSIRRVLLVTTFIALAYSVTQVSHFDVFRHPGESLWCVLSPRWPTLVYSVRRITSWCTELE